MNRRAALRASDADREEVAERLRKAAAEGRLLAEELEQRLEAAFSARTYGELDSLTADLPGGGLDRRRPRSLRPLVLPTLALAIAIPIALAVVAAVAFLLTGLLATWGLWLFVGWWFLGHRTSRYRRPAQRPGSGRVGRAGWGPAGGFSPWL